MIEQQQGKTEVWIIDDNVSFCVVLAEVLNRTKNFACKKYCHAVKPAIKELTDAKVRPKIILLDINMPIASGLEAIIPIKKIDSSMFIVMLTSFDSDHEIKTALQRGADGYLSKSTNQTDIIRSLERLLEGGKIIDPQIAEKVIHKLIGEVQTTDYHLSKREKEIIKLLVEGNTSTGIAEKLNISFFTVETHRKNIFEKLDVHTTHGLVAKVLKEGLID